MEMLLLCLKYVHWLKSKSPVCLQFLFYFFIFHVYIFFQLPRYGALVFIDECHATGFLGETGRGTEEYFGMKGKVDIINSTLGKALGGIFSLYPYTIMLFVYIFLHYI